MFSINATMTPTNGCVKSRRGCIIVPLWHLPKIERKEVQGKEVEGKQHSQNKVLKETCRERNKKKKGIRGLFKQKSKMSYSHLNMDRSLFRCVRQERISIRGSVRPSVRRSVRRSVRYACAKTAFFGRFWPR